jgi:hypothetical protein
MRSGNIARALQRRQYALMAPRRQKVFINPIDITSLRPTSQSGEQRTKTIKNYLDVLRS